MDIQDWMRAQVDTIKNCVDILDEKIESPYGLLIQLWALKKHVDATIDYLERRKKYG